MNEDWVYDPYSGQMVYVGPGAPGAGGGGGGGGLGSTGSTPGDPGLGGMPTASGGAYWDPFSNQWITPAQPYPAGVPQGYLIWNPSLSQYVLNPNFTAGGQQSGQGDSGHQGGTQQPPFYNPGVPGGTLPGGGGGATPGGTGGSLAAMMGLVPANPGFSNTMYYDPKTGYLYDSQGKPYQGNGQYHIYDPRTQKSTATTQPPAPLTSSPASSAPGSTPTGGVPGATPSSSSSPWSKYAPFVYGGLNAITGYLSANEAKKANQAAIDAANKNRTAALGYSSPAEYSSLVSGMVPFYRGLYKPALLDSGEAIALSEQGNEQAFSTDVARRGLTGSGIDIAGRNAIHAGRTAAYSGAVRDYETASLNAADQAAKDVYHTQVTASSGNPIPSGYAGPSTAVNIAGGLIGGAGAYALSKTLQNYPYLYPGQ